ncbi:hypothetical protein HRR80_003552 [Exophiala dermatitidis]|uniref:Uncharacterized protein n=1 Tax=Exophiala dermatitidis TaxID=5970 RepID=A0AAN6EVL3_EXODE|nr:hypothetical protein HRR80_003552 [Exophiala dermatitidis]
MGGIGNPNTPKVRLDNLCIKHWAMEMTMSQQAIPEKRIRYPFGEEYSAYTCRNFCEGISNTTDHHVLEEGGMLSERGLFLFLGEKAFFDQLKWELEDYQGISGC